MFENSKDESLSFNELFNITPNDQTCNLLDIKYDSYEWNT